MDLPLFFFPEVSFTSTPHNNLSKPSPPKKKFDGTTIIGFNATWNETETQTLKENDMLIISHFLIRYDSYFPKVPLLSLWSCEVH